MADAFNYTKLPPNHFRLIKLTGFRDNGNLSCELQHVALESMPEYDAISYAWNNELPSVPISCCNRELLITPSLHEALCTFYKLGLSRLLWADAVCINQLDDLEKADQVALMGQFYSNAQCVLVWLGSAGLHTDLAMDSITNLNICLSGAPDSIVITEITMQSYGLPSAKDPIWKGAGDIFARPWFRRSWTLQEVVLANDVVFLCGTKTTKWRELSPLANNIIRVGLLPIANPSGDFDSKIRNGLDSMTQSINIREAHEEGKTYPLMDLCYYARVRETFEPLDRVYAVLGLVDEATRKEIVIDYSAKARRQYWTVYLNMVATLLVEDTHLFLLSIAASEHRPPGLPSWCPNLKSAHPRFRLARKFYQAGSAGQHATKDTPPAFRGVSSSNKTCINLHGINVDDVSQVASSNWLWEPNQYRDCSANNLKWIYECRNLAVAAHPEPKKVTEDLVATLVANMGWNPAAYAPDGIELQQSARNLIAYLEILRDSLNGCIQMTEIELTRAQRYFNAVHFACSGRRFFCTKQGRLGLGPSETTVGDKVYVFNGAPVPFLLRRKSSIEYHTLVGEAYVHGMMQGEGLERELNAETSGETIEVV